METLKQIYTRAARRKGGPKAFESTWRKQSGRSSTEISRILACSVED